MCISFQNSAQPHLNVGPVSFTFLLPLEDAQILQASRTLSLSQGEGGLASQAQPQCMQLRSPLGDARPDLASPLLSHVLGSVVEGRAHAEPRPT